MAHIYPNEIEVDSSINAKLLSSSDYFMDTLNDD